MGILNGKERQREICYYILAYLADNPDASDTLEGIVKMWLLDQQIKLETRNVSDALTTLVSEGLVVEREEPDSRISYRINRTQEQTIRTMLIEMEGPPR